MRLEQGSALLLPPLQGTVLLILSNGPKGSLRFVTHHITTEKQPPIHGPLRASPDVVLQACLLAKSHHTPLTAVETLPGPGAAPTARALTPPPFARRGQTYGIFLSDPTLKTLWPHPIKRKDAARGTFALGLIPRLGNPFVQDLVTRRWELRKSARK